MLRRKAVSEMVYARKAQRGGKAWAIAQMCKYDRKCGVIVADRGTMDGMIALGVQPSQIIVMSEQTPRMPVSTTIDLAYNLDMLP